MMAEAKCRNILLIIIALTCTKVSAKAQVYITNHTISKTTKCLFSEYETSFTTYRLENGDIFVDEFIVDIEFPEKGSLDIESEKEIRKKISAIAIGDTNDIDPEILTERYISEKYLSKYEMQKITGDDECNNFISIVKNKNSMLSDEMFWEPVHYGSITGKLIYQTNSFISYSITEKTCDAMTCIRKETAFVYDIINKKILNETDFIIPDKIDEFQELIRNTMTREQKITYNKIDINHNSNFYIDEYGITYVFNSDKRLNELDATIHVPLNPKYIRQLARTESIVYKFFNIGQVERAKAKKQNKVISTN